MTIVFICGSLEFGRDGVGDYTRRLSSELNKQGHKTSIIALKDKYLINEWVGVQVNEGVKIEVLRIPATWSARQQLNRAKKWIDYVDPDWLSLQYVPFGFQPKGLPFDLNFILVSLGAGKKWHIMFHELWVGMDKESSLKYFFWGKVQKYLICTLIHKINPIVVHTQTHVYQYLLNSLGVKTHYLPLFSNIPITSTFNKVLKNKRRITFVLFGNIHPGAPIEDFAKEVSEYTELNKMEVKLLMLGRNGDELDKWVSIWQSKNLPVNILGEQSLDYISSIFSNSTIGIATTPIFQIEKSGSASAMKEHGLPVICVARPWSPRELPTLTKPIGFLEYETGNLKSIIEKSENICVQSNIYAVAQQFLNNLSI